MDKHPEPASNSAPPLASVVVCLYNAESFIGETIESVLAQTVTDLEVIVLDDGSTDRSLEVARGFHDPRLRIVERPHRGVVAALNEGIALARAPYIANLDHDDLWEPSALETHLRLLEENPELDLTFSACLLIDSASNRIGLASPLRSRRYGFTDLVEDYVIGTNSSAVFRRSALSAAGPADAAYSRLYDLDLTLRVALLRPQNIAAIPEPLSLYRRHPGQISADWKPLKSEWDLLVNKLRRLAPRRTARAINRGQVNMTRYFAYIAYEDRNFPEAARLIAAALAAAPGYFLTGRRNWMAALAILSGLSLPRGLHERLERLAGLRRSTRA